MDIIHEDYQVHYDAATATVICQGSLRLRGTEEYAPILQVLTTAAGAQHATLTLDLRPLQLLNSRGILMVMRWIMYVRDRYPATQLVIKGSRDVAWQESSLPNFPRLWPGLRLEME